MSSPYKEKSTNKSEAAVRTAIANNNGTSDNALATVHESSKQAHESFSFSFQTSGILMNFYFLVCNIKI